MAIYLIFFASGAAGLIYQVLWVRSFGNIFGNSVLSAAVVTAIFMLGLGAGSAIAGRLADRHFPRNPSWPLRAYAGAEVGIALLAGGSNFLLARLEPFSAGLSGYALGLHGWNYPAPLGQLLGYGAALVLLGPITLLMGGTLTLLVRHLVASDLGQAGWRIAALYGANTLGAALGCLAVDLWLVPGLGILRSQLVAATLNLGAGLAALLLLRPGVIPGPAPLEEPTTERLPRRPLLMMSLAILLSGWASMGAEIIWFRHLSSLLRSQRNVFSLLLFFILLGLGCGAALGGQLAKRPGSARKWFAIGQAAFAITLLGGLTSLATTDLFKADDALRLLIPPSDGFRWSLEKYFFLGGPIAYLVLAPALAMGMTFPLANAEVQRSLGHVGRRAGWLYLANTVGAVIGSLSAAFLILPWLGVQGGAAALAGLALASLPALYWSDPEPFLDRSTMIWISAAALSTLGFLSLPRDELILRTIPARIEGEQILAAREGPNETLLITERANGDRRLVTNGYSMSSNAAFSQRYMRLFSHLPLLELEHADRAAVICFGAGNTLDAALMHPLTQVDLIDLSQDVLEHGHWFAQSNHNALEDPRVHVYIDDGRQFLRHGPEGVYDLITTEPPPLANAGVSSLYSVEFYRLVKSRLRPGGFFTQWLPIYQVPEKVGLEAVAAFVAVFPDAVLWSGAGQELILMGRKDLPIQLTPSRWREQLEARPLVQKDLARVYAGTLVELVGSFLASSAALASATQGVEPLSDDRPQMEYDTAFFAPERRVPAALFQPGGLGAHLSGAERSQVATELEHLDAYQEILAALYQSELFLNVAPAGPGVGDHPPPSFQLPARTDTAETIAASPYLQVLLSRYGLLRRGPPAEPSPAPSP